MSNSDSPHISIETISANDMPQLDKHIDYPEDIKQSQDDAIHHRKLVLQNELKQKQRELEHQRHIRDNIVRELHNRNKQIELSMEQKKKLKLIQEQEDMHQQEIDRINYDLSLIKQAYDARADQEIKMIKDQQHVQDLKHQRKEKISHHFEYGVLGSKFIILITLLVVSFVNSNVEFIAKEPQKFLGEAIMIGGTSAIATVVIGVTRMANRDTILNAMLLAFMIFFIFHILMEFSGMNGLIVIDNTTLTDEQRVERATIESNIDITSKVVGSVFAIVGITMLYMTSQVWDFKNWKSSKHKYMLEVLTFGLLSAVPAYIIDINRGNSEHIATITLVKMLGLYSGGYFMLQAGGFFSSIFGSMPATYTKDLHSSILPSNTT